MENQQHQSTTTLCRNGCGFFGAASMEGYCSKCYKDHVKRDQDVARLSPTMNVSSVPMAASSSSMASSESNSSSSSGAPSAPSPTSAASPSSLGHAPSSSVEKAMTCSQAALSTEEVAAKLESAVAQAEATLSASSSAVSLETTPGGSPAPEGGPPAKKINRCGMCKKKVGLTGFPCRCGGLYCGEHRYDTAHACSFDYKTMEREQIAKNNPVVVSDKIQRI